MDIQIRTGVLHRACMSKEKWDRNIEVGQRGIMQCDHVTDLQR